MTRLDKFSNNPVAEWNEDGRTMTMVSGFTYVDPDGILWRVPPTYKVNGSSIPEMLWSIVGSPYVGKHRFASIPHDYYCEHMLRSWQKTHRMYYDACITAGVPATEARVKYFAIRRFGPKWTIQRDPIHQVQRNLSREELASELYKAQYMSLGQIEAAA
jgi:hypothetical protein